MNSMNPILSQKVLGTVNMNFLAFLYGYMKFLDENSSAMKKDGFKKAFDMNVFPNVNPQQLEVKEN